MHTVLVHVNFRCRTRVEPAKRIFMAPFSPAIQPPLAPAPPSPPSPPLNMKADEHDVTRAEPLHEPAAHRLHTAQGTAVGVYSPFPNAYERAAQDEQQDHEFPATEMMPRSAPLPRVATLSSKQANQSATTLGLAFGEQLTPGPGAYDPALANHIVKRSPPTYTMGTPRRDGPQSVAACPNTFATAPSTSSKCRPATPCSDLVTQTHHAGLCAGASPTAADSIDGIVIPPLSAHGTPRAKSKLPRVALLAAASASSGIPPAAPPPPSPSARQPAALPRVALLASPHTRRTATVGQPATIPPTTAPPSPSPSARQPAALPRVALLASPHTRRNAGQSAASGSTGAVGGNTMASPIPSPHNMCTPSSKPTPRSRLDPPSGGLGSSQSSPALTKHQRPVSKGSTRLAGRDMEAALARYAEAELVTRRGEVKNAAPTSPTCLPGWSPTSLPGWPKEASVLSPGVPPIFTTYAQLTSEASKSLLSQQLTQEELALVAACADERPFCMPSPPPPPPPPPPRHQSQVHPYAISTPGPGTYEVSHAATTTRSTSPVFSSHAMSLQSSWSHTDLSESRPPPSIKGQDTPGPGAYDEDCASKTSMARASQQWATKVARPSTDVRIKAVERRV